MRRTILRGAGIVFALLALLAPTVIYWLYGGGERFPDRTTLAQLPPEALELVAELTEPPGNIAVSSTGRVFITVHPEAKPEGNKLLELVDGKAVPFPRRAEAAGQITLNTPLGLRIDNQDRLWILDHGDHGRENPALTAIEIKTESIVHHAGFDAEAAPWGSFLQDFVIDPRDGTIFIADAGIVRRSPGLIIYNPQTQRARRFLEGDDSVMPQDYKVYTASGPMDRFGGLITLKVGVDSIAIDDTGEWLYYGAMNHGSLYRIKTSDVKQGLPEVDLRQNRQMYAAKVMSDGIVFGPGGVVYLSDIEHGAIAVIGPDRRLATLLRSPRLRWPDGLSLAPGGYLYVADSDLSDVVFRNKEQIRRASPYQVFRIKLRTP